MRVLDELEIKAIVEKTREQIIEAATKKCECTPFNAPCMYHKIAYNVMEGMEDMMLSWNDMSKENNHIVETTKTIGMTEDQFNEQHCDYMTCTPMDYPNDGITYCK